ncbi:MAG: HEAT repeat domain-containing protein [Acidobacteriota bacterium]
MARTVLLRSLIALGAIAVLTPLAPAQAQPAQPSQAPAAPVDPQIKIRAIRALADRGEDGLAAIAAYANDPSIDVRVEMVKRIAEIGGPRVQPALLRILRDPDPEIQIRATDGLVNIYLPGYLKTSVSRNLARTKDGVRVSFDGNEQVVDGYVTVPPEVTTALGDVMKSSPNFDSRANAARALGVLHAQSAVPDLLQALYSKNDQLMFESLIALQKVRDPSAGPRLAFLVRDLSEPVKIAALRTVGILRTKQALPDIRYLLRNSKGKAVEREALTALSRIADPTDHDEFVRYLVGKDANLRTLGAEGLARIHNPADLHRLTEGFLDEKDMGARLAVSFAMVALGRVETTQVAPLGYLINTLNRVTYRSVVLSYLTELTRDAKVRQALYPTLVAASRSEKTGIAIVLGWSGEQDSVPFLDAMRRDSDSEVSQQATVSLRNLEARLKQ